MTAAMNETRMIPLADLRVAEWNARKSFDLETLAKFTESIKLHGVQVPLIVRILPASAWKTMPDAEVLEKSSACLYEIVAGHRRFKAAAILKLAELPCIVRELDDVAAREIGLVDNLQREDVPALEEADAYNELLSGTTGPAAIAQRVGKDVAYVVKRLRLVSLCELGRKALAERLITIDHALLLAPLAADEQESTLKWTLNPNAGIKKPIDEVIEERINDRDRKAQPGYGGGYWEPESVLELKRHIEQNVGRKLSSAPWDLDDANLVAEAGPCSSCPSNTKANNLLFGDMSIAAATCEDGLCFERKRAAFVQIKLATIPKQTVRDEPPKGSALNPVDRYLFPLRVSWKSTTVEPRFQRKGMPDRDGFNPDQVFRYGQWIDVKKNSCEFVRQAVAVDWDDDRWNPEKSKKPGKIVDVCVSAKCKLHRKAYQKQSANKDNGQQGEAARRAAEQKNREEEIAEAKLRVALASTTLDGVTKVPLEAARFLALTVFPHWDEGMKPFEAVLPGVKKILTEAKVDSPQFAKAVALACIAAEGRERALTPQHYFIAESRKKLLPVLKRLGWSGPDPWAKPATPKAEKQAAKKAAPKKPAKKTPAKKAAKKGGR